MHVMSVVRLHCAECLDYKKMATEPANLSTILLFSPG